MDKEHKKIDVLNDEGEVLASIGELGMKDYPTYLKEDGKEVAEYIYRSRHAKNISREDTPVFFAGNILW